MDGSGSKQDSTSSNDTDSFWTTEDNIDNMASKEEGTSGNQSIPGSNNQAELGSGDRKTPASRKRGALIDSGDTTVYDNEGSLLISNRALEGPADGSKGSGAADDSQLVENSGTRENRVAPDAGQMAGNSISSLSDTTASGKNT